MRQLSNKQILLLLPWLWFIISIYYKYTSFQTNDDPGYLLIASGWWYGTPSDQLIFISRPLGWIIAKLYTVTDKIPWYVIALNATQAFAISQILLISIEIDIKTNCRENRTAESTLYLLASFSSIFFISIQFTQVAIITSGIGTILLLFAATKIRAVLGCILIILGMMWRTSGGFFSSLLIVAITLPIYINKENYKKYLLILLVVLFSIFIDWLSWSTLSPLVDSDVKEYIAFNKIRSLLDGGGGYAESEIAFKIAEKVGLSNNDWTLFLNWYFANPEVYTTNKLSEIADYRTSNHLLTVLKNSIKLNSIFEFLNQFAIITLALVVYIIGIIAIFGKLNINIEDKKIYLKVDININFIKILISTFAITSVILYVVYMFGRMPPRVLWPSLFILGFTNLILLLNESENISNSYSHVNVEQKNNRLNMNASTKNKVFKNIMLLLSAILPLLLVHLYTINNYNKVNKEKISDFKTDKPIVAFPEFYSSIVAFHPYELPQNHLKIWPNIISMGTAVRSPNYKKQLMKFNLTEDLIKEIIKGNAYLGTLDGSKVVEYVQEYAKEHFNYKIHWDKPLYLDSTGKTILSVKRN